MQVVLWISVFVLIPSASATSTVREYDLEMDCNEICPDLQCWNLTIRNPFPQPAAWSAVVNAQGGAIDIAHSNADVAILDDGIPRV